MCTNYSFGPLLPSDSSSFKSITSAAGTSLSPSHQSSICIWAWRSSQASSLLLIPTAAACGRANGMREGFYTEGATWNLERWHRSCLQHSFVMKKILYNDFAFFVTETEINRPPISVSLCRHLSLRENTQLGIFSSPWNNLSIIFSLQLLIFCLRQETTGLGPETKLTSYWWPLLRTTPYYNEQEWNHSDREDIFFKFSNNTKKLCSDDVEALSDSH